MVEHVINSMDEIITNDYSETHQALDLVSSEGNTDIIALDSGIVEEVVTNSPSTDHTSTGLATYGNYVKIKQNNGKSALYAHMKYGSINVNVGDYIEKGAIIGTMGSTGNAYGDHLHLEIKDESGLRENPIISLTQKSEPPKEESPKQETNEEIKTEQLKQTIDVTEAKTKTNHTEYISNTSYYESSIVDGLKEIGIDSSYDYREKIAQKNGIQNYRGTYEQNVYLLQLLKDGKLIKA